MSFQPTPLNLLSVFVLGLYDSDDPPTHLVGDLVNAGARCVKVESSGAAQARYAAGHGLLTIGRSIKALEEPMQGIAPSADAAHHWVNEVFLPWVEQYGGHARDVYWEDAYNELGDLEEPATLAGFNDFEVTRQQMMHDLGYRCCVGNFSAEARLFDKVTPFLPAIRLAAQLGNLLGLHAYASPRLIDPDTGAVDSAIGDFLFPEEALASRLAALGEPMPAVVHTEFGIDSILSLSRTWPGWRLVPDMSGEEYFREIVTVCQRKKACGLVKGAFVFVDDADPASRWSEYNIHGGRPARPKQNDPGELAVTTMILNHHHDYPDDPIVISPVSAPAPAPAPIPAPPLTGPAVTRDDGTLYNLRLTPAALGATNLLRGQLPPGTKVQATGVTQNGYAQLQLTLSLDPSGPSIAITGWLLASGLETANSQPSAISSYGRIN